MELWALCFEHLRNDTGEILLSREEIAEKLGQPADDISKIMSELVDFGAIIRKRQRVVGLKGPGMVHYFMNPKVATHREGQVRNKAQEDATPLLTLMEGGKAPKPA
jgi:predicted transcriptional regulator